MKRKLYTVFLTLSFAINLFASHKVLPPAPCYPVPTEDQVRWQKMESYAFIHFGLNTFNDREWGYGDSPLSTFNPTKLDCEQWVKTFVKAGLKGVILTCKHHDGFCLWPTKYTDYCIRNTPYKNGKGDLVKELSAACKKYGIKFGVYLSPWDRHQAFYGTPFYVEYFYNQLHELLSNYGDLFEVWFDGANGGDGWYGGAKEVRTIDRRTYYDFPRAYKMMAELQPHAIAFSDGGPGCRWVGNEKGFAGATNWSFLRKGVVYPGYDKSEELQYGHADGNEWVAAECDVSMRPGWFYHAKENAQVKSVDQLTDLYYRSVGHNGTLLLNFPVDKDGLIYPLDSANAVNLHRRIENELKTNLLLHAKIKASNVRGREYSVKNLTDNRYDTYWATDDGVLKADLNISFNHPVKINRLKLQEYIPLGQRVKSFIVEIKNGNNWLPINVNEETTTIGYKRLLRFKTVIAKELRIRFLDSRACLCINELGAYYAPQAKDNSTADKIGLKGLPYQLLDASGENELILDLGKVMSISSLHYQPAKAGILSNYEILAGNGLDNLKLIASGEFSNIRNNPIMQDVYFTPTTARYVVLKAVRMIDDSKKINFDKLIIQ